MPQDTSPIYGMTQFDLDVMNEFIYMNSLLFALEQEEIDAVTASCQKVVRENLITSPAQADKVEINYIKMVADVVDDIRENFPMSAELIQNITSILNRYFDTIFSKIMMKRTSSNPNSFDICLNYYNCKNAKDDLEQWLKTKGDYNKR